MDEWLAHDQLARLVVDTVEQLDLSAVTRQYRGAGAAADHPAVLLALLLYGYATGTFGSRRLAHATPDALACRFIAATTHPAHDTRCACRNRFLPEVERLFVAVLSIATQMTRLKLGTSALDGTQIHAHAARHRALSSAHAPKLAAPLQAAVTARSTAARDPGRA